MNGKWKKSSVSAVPDSRCRKAGSRKPPKAANAGGEVPNVSTTARRRSQWHPHQSWQWPCRFPCGGTSRVKFERGRGLSRWRWRAGLWGRRKWGLGKREGRPLSIWWKGKTCLRGVVDGRDGVLWGRARRGIGVSACSASFACARRFLGRGGRLSGPSGSGRGLWDGSELSIPVEKTGKLATRPRRTCAGR